MWTRCGRSRRHRHARHVLMWSRCRRSRRHWHTRRVLMWTRCRSRRRHWPRQSGLRSWLNCRHFCRVWRRARRRHRHARCVLMWNGRRRRFWRSRLARGTTWLSSRRAFPRRLFRRRRFMHGVVVLGINYRAAHKEQRHPQHPNNSQFPVSNNSVHDQSLRPILR